MEPGDLDLFIWVTELQGFRAGMVLGSLWKSNCNTWMPPCVAKPPRLFHRHWVVQVLTPPSKGGILIPTSTMKTLGLGSRNWPSRLGAWDPGWEERGLKAPPRMMASTLKGSQERLAKLQVGEAPGGTCVQCSRTDMDFQGSHPSWKPNDDLSIVNMCRGVSG